MTMTRSGRRRALRPTTLNWWLPALGLLLLLLAGLVAKEARTESQNTEFRRLEGLYEPSGVGQLDDGRLVVVEDEPSRPFILLTPDGGAEDFRVELLRPRSLLEAVIGGIDDLEGVAVGPEGFVYAITSHSRKQNGKRGMKREKLVRFKVEGDRLAESAVRGDLRKSLTRAFPELKDAAKERKVKRDLGLNIEGLAFDEKRERLWIGFRGPMVDEKAILVAILNPHQAFEQDQEVQFIDTPVLLDLDRGGIRDLAFDPRLGGYLILSQREGTKKEKAFKLWLWSGDPAASPRRVRIDGIDDLERAEGVAPVNFRGEDKILLVSDDGASARGKGARYLLVDYALLKIDPESS